MAEQTQGSSTLNTAIQSFDKRVTRLEKEIETVEMRQNVQRRLEREDILDAIKESETRIISKLFDLVDPVMKEISDTREERLLIGYQVSRNAQRIESLETKVIGKPQLA